MGVDTVDAVMTDRPPIRYPEELPISQRREELKEAIRDHQVVIVAGETGSGKSTQLPKICLDLGRGVDKFIGHTQPRRLAARSIAERVAEELDTTVGELVGYTVRFTDQVGDHTAIKLMTDGILLAEMQRDRKLSRYDTIIIDEAHERSLTIDFLLGYLKQLLPKRPDLKVIVTSATIDTARFAEHFDDAPIIEVSGRTYPVEYRYDPIDEDGRDQPTGICDAVKELTHEGPGDILVFCAGERDIREAADELEKLKLPNTEVFPLYARLSAAEQHRVFSSHSGRRIVVATNVAETSLTVPGIRYVVDPGNARISRYSRRTKVQRLPIEEVSQASANQRAGRCGRVGPGICIRLYSEDNYLSRPEFTEPEIQRTNLAAVILQMASLRLGAAEDFPFIDPPDSRAIADGIDLLVELDAVDPDHEGTRKWLTGIGMELARLPVDPRLGRMILEADKHGCLHEVMVITAAMSVQDPRERPSEKREAAAESHVRFRNDSSDFLSYINLWNYVREQRDELSQNQFRKLCRREFLNYNRIREWQDIYRQLNRVVKELKLRVDRNEAAPDAVHQALLAGLLSQIGVVDESTKTDPKVRSKTKGRKPLVEYRGARGAKFAIAPDSALRKATPDWVMAGELVETNRLWARTVTAISPLWVEHVAEHLMKYSYGEPWWDADRGSASVHESATLYGLPIIARRRIQVRAVNPSLARELFIHHVMVEGEWKDRSVAEGHLAFLENNEGVLAEVATIEARARVRNISVDYDTLFDFFDERLPDHVCSVGDFDQWWKNERRKTPHLLSLEVTDLVEIEDDLVDETAFPLTWPIGGHELALTYEFDETSPSDGVTVEVPVGIIAELHPTDFVGNVPGLREDVITALIRSLPKQLRKAFVPVPETVAEVLPQVDGEGALLVDQLRAELLVARGVDVPADAFDLEKLPDRLRPTFAVVDANDEIVAEGKDLSALAIGLEAEIRTELAEVGHELERSGITEWTIGTLPTEVVTERSGHEVTSYPALHDDGDSVSVWLFATPGEQAEAMLIGTRRLLRLNVAAPLRLLNDKLDNDAELALAASRYPSKKDWFEDCIGAGIDQLVERAGGPAFDEKRYRALEKWVRKGLAEVVDEASDRAVDILVLSNRIEADLDAAVAESLAPSVLHMRNHLARLVYPGHLADVGVDRLPDIERYLRAIAYRIEKLPERVRADQQSILYFRDLEAEYSEAMERGFTAELAEAAWMLEELRVVAFAQPIGATGKVSERAFRALLIPSR